MVRHRRRKKENKAEPKSEAKPALKAKVHKIHHKPSPPPMRKINWRAAEYHYIEKDYIWYTAIVVVAALLLFFAIWQRNFFFGVFIIIAAVLVIEFGKRRPRILEYEINEKGIFIDKKPYLDYKSIEAFHVRKRLGFLDEIVIRKTSKVNPFAHLPIDDKLVIEAREFLLEYLLEEEHEPSFAEIIAERIGF